MAGLADVKQAAIPNVVDQQFGFAREDRTFSVGRGGLGVEPTKTALLFIEFQA